MENSLRKIPHSVFYNKAKITIPSHRKSSKNHQIKTPLETHNLFSTLPMKSSTSNTKTQTKASPKIITPTRLLQKIFHKTHKFYNRFYTYSAINQRKRENRKHPRYFFTIPIRFSKKIFQKQRKTATLQIDQIIIQTFKIFNSNSPYLFGHAQKNQNTH